MSGYYDTGVTRAVLMILLISWGSGELRVAWAEQKPSARQGRDSTNQVTPAKPLTRSSVPVRKTVENPPKHNDGKTLAVERVESPLRGKAARRTHRHAKKQKQLRPYATAAPKPDLSYHGMLEQPQRYAPQYQHRKGEAPNPNAGTLLHDHFQELDKNRDGSIDPFERAFGRLDMDRDLADRQWQ